MAELRLDVTLNLAGFRAQLEKLATEAGARYFGVKLSVDGTDFKKQLKNLEKIKPVITINDSQLIAARERIGTLNKSLVTLRKATSTPIEIKIKYVEQGKPPTGAISKSGTFRQRLTGLDAEPIKQLYAAAGKAGLVQFDAEIAKNKSKIITALNQAGESSVTGLLNGLKSKDSAVKTAAKSLGDILIAALKLSLQIQSPSKKMEAIGEDAGEGFNKGLKESLSEAKNSAVSKMRELVAALNMVPKGIAQANLAKLLPSGSRFEAATAPASSRGGSRVGSGFRALPEGVSQSGAGVEFSEMMRRFRGEIAGLTTNPKKYEQLLNALPDRRITTDLADVASRRSRAAEMPSFMPIQQILGPGELEKKITGDLAQYLKSMRIPNPWVGPTGDYQKFIGNISRATRQLASQPLLPSPKAVKLLPPGSSSTFQQTAAARTQIAYQRSAARSATVLGGPSGPVGGGGGGGASPRGGGGGLPPAGGGGNPPRPPSGGGGGAPPRGGGGGAFGGMQFAMPQLPGRGIVQELGAEFGFAAKQVLLFGAAYKALAFLTDFPSQVGSAVGQLQSFRNTLKSITPSTAEFGQSSQFILSLVDQYNIPLQSARDGFAKLYASMEPAGFSGKEIRDLFEGVSMGAATFGMSADKVDRVMYAFAQMASKGQIMSEELKGQLGDVLPGSLALFAKAAKMSVSDFSKAMEDGAFKGNAMRELLIKVGATMKEEFGKGAVGAAATFQGVMNRLQTSTTLFYEAFEPAAVAFSNTFVLPLTNGLRVVTEAFTQLMTGQKAVTVSGADLAAQMQPFIPIFQGIGKNLVQVGQAALGVAKSLTPIIQLILQLLASPIVGWLAQTYASVILLQGAFTLLGGRAILGAIAGLAQYSIGAARAAIVSQTMASQALSAQMQLRLLASGAATTGVAISTFAVAVRTAFITTAAGAVVVAVGMMISEFMRLRGVMDDIEGRYKSVADQARMMGQSGNVSGLERLQNEAIEQANTYEKIVKGLKKAQDEGIGNQGFLAIDKNTADLIKKIGQGSLLSGEGKNIITIPNAKEVEKLVNLNRKNYKENQKIIDDQERKAERKEKELKAGGPGKGTKNEDEDKKKTNLESYYNLQDQLAKASTQADIDRINAIFEHRKSLINSVYDLEEARANSIQKEAIAHQKAVANIFLDLQKKQIDARLDVLKAQGSVAGGASGVVGGGAGGAAGATGLLQGSTGISSGPHFDVRRQDRGYISEQQARALFDSSVNSQLTMTSAYGRRTAPTPGASSFHRGVDLAGKANTPLNLAAGYSLTGSGEKDGLGYAASIRGPAGEMYDVGHLQRPSAASAGAPRKVPGSEKRDVVAAQAVEIAQQRESLTFTHAQTEAQVALNIAKETYLAQIFGIAEKELQLGQSQKQTALLKAGFTDNEIEDEMKLETIRLKHAAGINEANKALDFYNGQKRAGIGDQKIINDGIDYQNNLIKRLNKELPQSIKLQQDLNKEGREYAFSGRIRALKDEIQLLTTVDDAERRLLELRQGNLTPKEAQQIYSLEKVKKNLEDTKALIGNFVSSTSSDYKGFLKAVISGEDAVDALQKFQEGLTDKVLTIFLDFAMAPMENMMKKSLEGLFMPKVKVDEVPVTANTNELTKNTAATIANTTALGSKALAGGIDPMSSEDFSNSVPVKVQPFVSPESAFAGFDTENMFAGLNDQIRAGLAEIPSSFAEATANLQISSEPFKQALITDLPNALTTANTGVQTQGALFGEGLTNFVGGLGAAAAGIAGIAAGISQIGKGGTSNVLGGIGSILMGAGGAIGGFGKIFGFADGGMVSQPTLGMVGEGKYNEAIVPLPNGRSIPVQFNQESSLRSAMGNNGSNNNPVSPVLNMSFETTRFGNTDYVSREQLEAAMMQTRAEATKAGARRGMTMTLDKLQQSPSTRSRVGLG